jgi:hypothetical protein
MMTQTRRVAAMLMLLSLGAEAHPFAAHPVDVQNVLAVPLKRIETADYRAVGQLVHVDGEGKRMSYPIRLKVHWFPGVLRVMGEIDAPGPERIHMLLEMRQTGQSTIAIAHPGDKAPVVLPFDQWGNGPVKSLGSGFSYEDFLEPEYFWPDQSVTENTKFGARICDLLTSTSAAPDRTHYAKVKSWLDHAIGYPVYVEKTLKGTETTKEFTYFGLRQNGGVWSASQVEEKTRGQHSSTLLVIERGSTKANLGLKDFSPEQLTRF